MNILARLLFIVLIIINAGCDFKSDSGLRGECDSWLSSFYEKPMGRRIAEFGSYDLDSQYQIFLCGNQVLHPPAIYLAEPFARKGRVAVPLLKAKLELADDDLTIRDIILVFSEMSRLGSYSVSKDADLMKLIRKKADGMHDPEWRDIARENVNKLTLGGK